MRTLGEGETLIEYFRSILDRTGESPSSVIEALRDLDRQCTGLSDMGRLDFLQKRLEQRIVFHDWFFERYKDDSEVMTRLQLKWPRSAPGIFETAKTGLTEMIALGISGQEVTREELEGSNIERVLSFLYDIPNPRVFRIYLGGMSAPAIKYALTGYERERALQAGRERITKLLLSGRDNDGFLVVDIYKESDIQRYMFRCSGKGLETVPRWLVPEYRNDDEFNVVTCEFYPASGEEKDG